jgi:hypothetical protein
VVFFVEEGGSAMYRLSNNRLHNNNDIEMCLREPRDNGSIDETPVLSELEMLGAVQPALFKLCFGWIFQVVRVTLLLLAAIALCTLFFSLALN